jgi:hypothetical protein
MSYPYNEFIELFKDKYKRSKARAYACVFVCIPIQLIFGWFAHDTYKVDAWIGIILLSLGVLFSERCAKLELLIRKTKKIKKDGKWYVKDESA